MINELIERLKKLVGGAAALIVKLIDAVANLFNHSVVHDNNVIVASEGNVLDTGEVVQENERPLPHFSLFTFFANR